MYHVDETFYLVRKKQSATAHCAGRVCRVQWRFAGPLLLMLRLLPLRRGSGPLALLRIIYGGQIADAVTALAEPSRDPLCSNIFR